MDIYLIRHAETDGNRAWRHQHSDTSINGNGKAQLEKLVERVLALKPTHLITSTNLRAVQTAQAIALATDIVPVVLSDFEELRRPAFITGRRFIGLETLRYLFAWFYGKTFDDGESYPEFLHRLESARTYLESLPQDARVLVVSHSVFINMFVEHRCRPKPLSLAQAVWRFLKIVRHKNTGVTHLRYHPTTKGTCAWEVVRRSLLRGNKGP